MEQTLPWILALGLLTLAAAVGVMLGQRRARRPKPLPTDWALAPRPVFNTDERRLYRQLREALPHHAVLAKLPLVRFCQPADANDVRYWYDLLGTTYVTFAICSANGRVLAAIDFDLERGSPRAQQVKQAVLAACRIRYLRCPVDHMPSIPELQLLVPQAGAASRSPQSAGVSVGTGLPASVEAGERITAAVATRKRHRRPLWQDSGFFHDSFFGVENRMEASHPGEFGPGASAATATSRVATGERSLEPPAPSGWDSRHRSDTDGIVVAEEPPPGSPAPR